MIMVDVKFEGQADPIRDYLIDENFSAKVVADQILQSADIDIKPDALINLTSQSILNSAMTLKEQGVKSGNSLLVLYDFSTQI